MKFTLSITALILQTVSCSLLAAEDAGIKGKAPIVDPLSGTNVTQVVMGLIAVLILVFAIAWLLRRVGGVSIGGGSGVLKVLAGMSMGARERVVLVQVGEEQLLLGVSPGRVQTLHVLETPIEVESASANNTLFANKLAEVLRGKGK